MRQLAAAMVALALTTAIAHGRTLDVPTFADIPWGAAAPDVVKAMTAAGFQMVEQDSDGDYRFTGKLFETSAIVYAFMSPASGLVKVQVRLAPEGLHARQKYAEVIRDLTLKYGDTEGLELYKSPYQRGDGREDEAIREGKGLLISSWGDDEEPGQAALVVRATGPVVGLDYESHGWTAEMQRRKRTLKRSSGPSILLNS